MLEHARKLPSAVSGGQQQRVAIARAMANDPPLLITDEPTGNLDSRTAETVFELFEGLVRRGRTVLIVTHDEHLARRTSRVVLIADGQLLRGGAAAREHSGSDTSPR
jgi:putative ABC transport system ATP-binding protein